MTEPKRWIDEGPPEAIERLLTAAAAERPPEASLPRTLTALGIGVGATGAASAAGAAATGALGAGSAAKATGIFALSALAKWSLLTTAIAAAGVAGTLVVRRASGGAEARRAVAPPDPPLLSARGITSPHAGVVSTTPRAGLKSTAPDAEPTGAAPANVPPRAVTTSLESQSVVPHALPAPSSVQVPRAVQVAQPAQPASATVAASPAIIDAEHLAEEVALVDRARAAFARGDAAGAISALDAYEARFAQRKFAPEALYLRMEALLRLGRTGTARSVAERLARAYPKSPHTARARQVLAETNP